MTGLRNFSPCHCFFLSGGSRTMSEHLSDTIAAIATPPGEGGIAVIRVSGDEAIHNEAALR